MLLKPIGNESVGKKIRPVIAGHIPGNIIRAPQTKERKEKKIKQSKKIINVRKGRAHG